MSSLLWKAQGGIPSFKNKTFFPSRFEALFTELEQRQIELGISTLGASVTTMEEVFIQ